MTTLCDRTCRKDKIVADYFYDLNDLCDKANPEMTVHSQCDFVKNGLLDEYTHLIFISMDCSDGKLLK